MLGPVIPVEDADTGFLAQLFQILDPTLLELNILTIYVSESAN